MSKIISNCPVCDSLLRISTLKCLNCGLEVKKEFELSEFDRLSPELHSFLLEFLKKQGNLKAVQNSMNISYPAAKKKMALLLEALGLYNEYSNNEMEEPEMDSSTIITNTQIASEIVRSKLLENGGQAVIHSLKGKEYHVWIVDNYRFNCDAVIPYYFSVFDVIVDLLLANGGKAKKGSGRAKLGSPKCEEDTVAGTIIKNYYGKKEGEYAFDPGFALIAILEWAGIINNEWGYIELTANFRQENRL